MVLVHESIRSFPLFLYLDLFLVAFAINIVVVLFRGTFVNRDSTSNDTSWYPSWNISDGTG